MEAVKRCLTAIYVRYDAMPFGVGKFHCEKIKKKREKS